MSRSTRSGPVAARTLERLGAISRLAHGIALGGEVVPQEGPDLGLVIDHEDAGHRLRRSALPGDGDGRLDGRDLVGGQLVEALGDARESAQPFEQALRRSQVPRDRVPYRRECRDLERLPDGGARHVRHTADRRRDRGRNPRERVDGAAGIAGVDSDGILEAAQRE